MIRKLGERCYMADLQNMQRPRSGTYQPGGKPAEKDSQRSFPGMVKPIADVWLTGLYGSKQRCRPQSWKQCVRATV